MKKLVFVCALVMVLLVGWSGAAFAAGASGNINLLLGKKYLDDDIWDDTDLDEHDAYGLMFDLQPAGWPISLALDFLKTDDSSDWGDGETQEIAAGVRWYSPMMNIVQFYAGGGLAFIEAEVDPDAPFVSGDDDDAIGAWINGGMKFVIARHLNLGIDLRYSMAEVELYDEDVDAGGLTAAFVIGYHF